MKKLTSILILLALVLPILGCSTPSQERETATVPDTLSVGYSRVCIDPVESVALDGYGNPTTRYCADITDSIYATATAISDPEGTTVVLINVDLITADSLWVDPAKARITEATGLPASNVVITCNHSHSTPAMNTNENYVALVAERLTQAATQALADRTQVTGISGGSVETEGMNFIRHYTVTDNETGEISVIGDNFGTSVGKTYTGHTASADPTMHLVKIDRQDADPVVLINWRAHPHFTGGSSVYDLSSDFIGPFREAFEELSGAHFMYLQGASGNVNEKSNISSENRTTDYKRYGCILAQYAMEGLDSMTALEIGTVQVEQVECYSDINKTMDQYYYDARAVQAIWSSTNDRAQALAAAGTAPIRSPYHANAIVANYSRTREEHGRMELTAITIGDMLALVTFPGEAFDTIGQYVEDNSPYEMTLFVGYANHHIGYLPNSYAWEYTSYETDITRFVQGTDLIVQQAYMDMLEKMKNN